MAQVKFYSVASLPSAPSNGGIYFVDGGELYKGASRFGAGRVTEVADVSAMESITGMIAGDVAVCSVGGAYAYTGSKWVAVGPDIGALTSTLTSSWQSDIGTSVTNAINALDAALVGVSAGTTKIITGVEEKDGVVTAYATDFPAITSPAAGYVSLAGTSVAITGYADLASKVSAIEGIVDAGANSVTASTGTFTNLTVTSTATFEATTVSATTLTVGGSTVEQLADKQIAAIAEATKTSASDGVTVTVKTSAGSVSGVDVAIAGATAAADFTSTATKVATAQGVYNYVTAEIAKFDNIMDFAGVVSTTADVSTPAKGDVVVIGATAASGFTAGQEYIYTGSSWELIGDQATYATKSVVEASVSALTSSINALESAVNASVASLASDISALEASITGGTSTASDYGVEVKVVTASVSAAPTVTVGVTAASTMTFGSAGSSTTLATTAAVADFYSNTMVWLDASGAALT